MSDQMYTCGCRAMGAWILWCDEHNVKPERCQARRGPRSKIRCEINTGHPVETMAHAARGSDGRWFFW